MASLALAILLIIHGLGLAGLRMLLCWTTNIWLVIQVDILMVFLCDMVTRLPI